MRVKSLARRSSIMEETREKISQQNPDLKYRTCPICATKYPLGIESCTADGAMLSEDVVDSRVNKVFAERFEILSVIGIGGMSTVYKARQKLLDRHVAIKVLDRELAKQQDAVKRFLQEARTLSKFDQENLVPIHDFGVTPDGQPFIVMDFLEGQTLENIIDKEGPLELSRALYLFLAASSGIAFAHENGIIHRDIKPGNFIVTADQYGTEHVKLLDFGLAKLKQSAEGYVEKLTQGDTMVIGTVDYMSPEHCQGLELDARTDVYSFGCVMYETLTGLEPFGSDNLLQTIQNQIHKPPMPFKQLNADLKIPDAVEQVVFKALEKNRDKRYQTIGELRTELRQLYRKLG